MQGIGKSHLLAFVLQQLHVKQGLFFQKPLDHISLWRVPAENQKSHSHTAFVPFLVHYRKEIKIADSNSANNVNLQVIQEPFQSIW